MHRRRLTILGVVCLVAVVPLPVVFGADSLGAVLTGVVTTTEGALYGCLVSAGVAFLVAGRAERVGPLEWRSLAATGYAVLAVVMIGFGLSLGDWVPLVGLGGAGVLLAGIGTDIALDTRVLVTLETDTDRA